MTNTLALTRARIGAAVRSGTADDVAAARQDHQREMLRREILRRGPLMRGADRVELARELIEAADANH